MAAITGTNLVLLRPSPTLLPLALIVYLQTTFPRLTANGRSCWKTTRVRKGKEMLLLQVCIYPSSIFYHFQDQLCDPLRNPSTSCESVPLP